MGKKAIIQTGHGDIPKLQGNSEYMNEMHGYYEDAMESYGYDPAYAHAGGVMGKIYKVIPTWNPNKTIAVTCSYREAQAIAAQYKENETYIEEEDI